ncbi:PREDICTED: uncharacterized protein LOC109147109 [Ipomoea nil]|uniref:uncharacterized protein LOC109147109 n=1 Tax=Ipomoea nil TaxID=35883 RepID=UPI000900F32D|nr:PREDICTED: uncharacterized protein LOC109147109 [Ipomoea nil]
MAVDRKRFDGQRFRRESLMRETLTENGLGDDFSNNLPEIIAESEVSLIDEVTNMNAVNLPNSNSASSDDDENLAITAEHEPTLFSEAVQAPHWREAMRQELQSLEDDGTWILEDLLPGHKAIDNKWVYKVKYNADGSIERYKARLVVQGDRQIKGVDYNETFAPTIKMVTVCAFLAVAVAHG